MPPWGIFEISVTYYTICMIHLVYDKAIGTRAIRDASRKYYEEKIEPFFGIQKFRLDTFEERSSIFSLKELLEKIVIRARELRSYRDLSVMRTISGRPPTSHFHVLAEFDLLLSTLELNFFLTKYFEMKDRDGRKVSVFALNFGLCEKHSSNLVAPPESESIGFTSSKEFSTTRRLSGKTLSIIKKYKVPRLRCSLWPRKTDGSEVIWHVLSNVPHRDLRGDKPLKRYETILENVQAELLLPATELGIF